jgi:hypothetical protein
MATVLEKPAAASRKFPAMAAEAEAVCREQSTASAKFDAHHASAPRDTKQTKPAFLRDACRNGKTSVDKLRKLQKALAAEPPESRARIDVFVATVARRCSATRFDEGYLGEPPKGNLIALLPRPDHQAFPNFMIETQMCGTSPLECVALGVLLAADTAPPEAWGTADDLDEEKAKAEERSVRLDALIEALAAAWTAEDTEFQLTNPQTGDGRLVWRLAPTVSVYPLPAGARALVEHLAASD